MSLLARFRAWRRRRCIAHLLGQAQLMRGLGLSAFALQYWLAAVDLIRQQRLSELGGAP
jgi:hypothetical protein